MKKLRLLPLLLAMIMLCGCAGQSAPETVDIAPPSAASDTDPAQQGGTITAQGDGMTAKLVAVEYPAPADPYIGGGMDSAWLNDVSAQDAYNAWLERVSALDIDYLAGVRRFAQDSAAMLLGEYSEDNQLYSPISLYFAMAMLAECAAGDTQAQLLDALGTDMDTLETNIQLLYEQLNISSSVSTCSLLDSIWLSDAYTFNAEPLSRLARFMYAESFSTDFYGEAYADDISAWVAENTGRLLGLDPAQFTVSPDTAMLLFNTVYFCGEWMNSFDAALTAEDDFQCSDGSVATCEFMNGSLTGVYTETDAYTAAELPLKYGSVRFILPGADCSPSDILGDAELFNAAAFGGMSSTATVNWMIPKVDYGVSQELTDLIVDLGASDAMDVEAADFSALSADGLFLSGALQECRVSMDENGVTAAAFTELMLTGSGLPEDAVDMYLNKPYIYIISIANLPLFIGIVNSADMEG